MRKEGTCEFAHTLMELKPPHEKWWVYKGVWKDGVDRWYGQKMAEYDVNRVRWYYQRTPITDIPTWAHGLKWYCCPREDQSQFDNFPADFGIEQDWSAVCAKRKSRTVPFEWAKGLWERIAERKKRLEADVAPAIPVRYESPDVMYPAKEKKT